MNLDLSGQTAVVTGAARGIGKSIALMLAKSGSNVAVADVDEAEAGKTAEEISALGVEARAYKLDVTRADEVASVFSDINGAFGRFDSLVNNAGITRDGLLLRMKEEDWTSVLDINLKSVFLCSKEAVKIMSKQKYGRIVNISSVVAFMGNPGQANYSASKAGMIGLTKTVAREYASRGINVNAVAPGFIKTAMTEKLSDKVRQQMLDGIPCGTFGEVDDVAGAVLFFVSPLAAYVTGQVIHVNGGMYM